MSLAGRLAAGLCIVALAGIGIWYSRSDNAQDIAALSQRVVRLYSEEKFDDAAVLAREAIERAERALGKDHSATVNAVTNLARIRYEQKLYFEAALLYRQAMEANERTRGESDPNTLSTMNSLASVYETQKRYHLAELLLKRALDINERVHGKNHPATVTSANNLAELYRTLGQTAEADVLEGQIAETGRSPSQVAENEPKSQSTRLPERAVSIEPENDLPVKAVTQLGHRGNVESVTFSPDGKFALSGSDDKTLRLWEVATGRELRSFVDPVGWINSVAFSPDGKYVLSGGGSPGKVGRLFEFESELKLWDRATGRQLRSFEGHTNEVASVAFSPDGKFALSGSSDHTLRLWEVATGRELRSFKSHTNKVESVAFSPDGKFILSGSSDNMLKLWEVATGQELRSFVGHGGWVMSVTFSPDGKLALSGSWDRTLKLWEVDTGRELKTFKGHLEAVRSVAFSPDGKSALSGSDDHTLKLWDVTTERELRSFKGHVDVVKSVAFSPDGQSVLSGSWDQKLKLWEAVTGREQYSFAGRVDVVSSVVFSRDGQFALTGNWDRTLKLWEVATGRLLRSFEGHSGQIASVALSPDGRFALSGGDDQMLKLWDVATGRELRTFKGHVYNINSVAFSPNGRLALSGSNDQTLRLWDVATGQELRLYLSPFSPENQVASVAFSPDGRFAISGGLDHSLKLWEIATRQELRSFKGHSLAVNSVAFSPDGQWALSGSNDHTLRLWEVATGRELRSFLGHTDMVHSVAFSPDGQFVLSGSWDHTLKLWEMATGRQLRTFLGHTDMVHSVAFSPDGKFALSGSSDGTARIWSIASGQELVRMMSAPDGEWLTMTPKGFFFSSHRDTDMLTIVHGFETTGIGQVRQSLYSPDLVREALAGDPDGEVEHAAALINLEKVVAAGPPPAVAITSHKSGSRSNKDLVTVAARITDDGRGIGRIEWRLNGVTTGVTKAPAGWGPGYEVTQQLALDPAENRIEVIAYEKRNLISSPPAVATIVYDGPADTVKPKLHVLAIGINAYEDKGWAASSVNNAGYFPALALAVGDANAFAAEIAKAAEGLYGEVRVKTIVDRQATRTNLDLIVREMASEISPRDTFVFYAAAHGYSVNGSYHMIPQDYQGGSDPEALKTRAIGQDHLQDWIANRIRAKKALILLDTCESGALVGGHTKSRTDSAASEAAVGRLHEATGRPVLTAAAAGKPAFEGYKGHGVFTYALMEALHRGDTNNNGRIELSELAAHVERRVPELVAEISDDRRVKGAAVIAMRGAVGSKQSARFGSTGEDFAIAARLP
jgi:WD40 repeat protein